MFIETSNKATVVLDKATSQRGYYFQLGVDPTYAFDNLPLTIETAYLGQLSERQLLPEIQRKRRRLDDRSVYH
jgi:hypothetical protein